MRCMVRLKLLSVFLPVGEARARTIQSDASLGPFLVLPNSLRFFAGEVVSLFESEVMVPASVEGVVWSLQPVHVIVPERNFPGSASLPGVLGIAG